MIFINTKEKEFLNKYLNDVYLKISNLKLDMDDNKNIDVLKIQSELLEIELQILNVWDFYSFEFKKS